MQDLLIFGLGFALTVTLIERGVLFFEYRKLRERHLKAINDYADHLDKTQKFLEFLIRSERTDKMRAVNNAVKVLNEALAMDPQAMNEIFKTEWFCNETLLNHPTIQASDLGYVRPIGLINGLFGVDNVGWGHIQIVLKDLDVFEIERFEARKGEFINE